MISYISYVPAKSGTSPSEPAHVCMYVCVCVCVCVPGANGDDRCSAFVVRHRIGFSAWRLAWGAAQAPPLDLPIGGAPRGAPSPHSTWGPSRTPTSSQVKSSPTCQAKSGPVKFSHRPPVESRPEHWERLRQVGRPKHQSTSLWSPCLDIVSAHARQGL